MPEGSPIRDSREVHDLLDPAIAVGRHDYDRGERSRSLKSKDEVMVELPLLPVVEDIEAAESSPDRAQEVTETQILS
jgi:hypothetical protein